MKNVEIFSRSAVFNNKVSSRHAILQEDNSVYMYWKADTSTKISPTSFTIPELEEIVRLAKVERNSR